MTSLALVLATALLLGALHAFDADHLAVVAAYIARRPSARSALGFALRWGLGHAATLLAVGMASALFSLAISADMQAAAELAVGATLLGVGTWVLAGLRRGRLLLRPHAHGDRAHTHLHRPHHPAGPARHSMFWVGALHGLAGSAGMLVIIPVGLMASTWAVAAYVAVFSAGVTAAMAGCALVLGGMFGRLAGGASARWYPWVAGAAGGFCFLLGLAWISVCLAARAA